MGDSITNIASGYRLGLVIIGIGITLPAFMVGAQIASSLPTFEAAGAIALGGIILMLLAMAISVIGVSRKFTTYQITAEVFGRKGSLVVAAIIGTSLVGWFAVTAAMFGDASAAALRELAGVDTPVQVHIAAGGVLMILTTVGGFSAIDRLSSIAVPLLLVLMVVTAGLALAQAPETGVQSQFPGSLTFGNAVSIVVGSFAVGATLVADYTRFARSRRDGMVAAGIGYGIGFPMILLLAAIPAILFRENNLVTIMFMLGMGMPAFLVIALATWTTNTANLYSSSLAYTSLNQRWRRPLVAVITGVLGTGLAMMGIMEYFTGFLIILSTVIPPVAGIIIADFYIVRRGLAVATNVAETAAFRPLAIIAWLAGIAIAMAGSYLGWFHISGIPALDGILTSAAVFVGVAAFKNTLPGIKHTRANDRH